MSYNTENKTGTICLFSSFLKNILPNYSTSLAYADLCMFPKVVTPLTSQDLALEATDEKGLQGKMACDCHSHGSGS